MNGLTSAAQFVDLLLLKDALYVREDAQLNEDMQLYEDPLVTEGFHLDGDHLSNEATGYCSH